MASGNAVLATANGLPLFEHGKLSGVTGKGGAKAKQVVSQMETTCFNVSSMKSCRDAFLRLGKQDCRIKSPIAKTWQLAETQECVSTVW